MASLRAALRLLSIVPVCLMLVMSTVDAQPASEKIVGLGATTCTKFASDAAADPTMQRDYLAWAQGFMSAILLSRPAGVDAGLDLDPPTFGLEKQLEFLRGYCTHHQSDDFSDAVVALYKALRQIRGR